MDDEVVILGSESPDADVLVYDKDKAYYTGNVTINPAGTEVPLEINPNGGANKKLTYEFVNEV